MNKKEYSKDKLDTLLQSYNIELPNAKLHDAVYIANWCVNTLYGSSIEDEKHLILFIKDLFNKESDLIFNRWYADMAHKGIPIDWYECR